eukprot:15483230-Heterocapsa_arctica.AAC.1
MPGFEHAAPVTGDQPPDGRLTGSSQPPFFYCSPSLLGNRAPAIGNLRPPFKAGSRQLARAPGLTSWTCLLEV